MTLTERFWAKVDRSGGPDACWPWTAGLADKLHPYGAFRVDNDRVSQAHIVAFELANGPVPVGKEVCHRCDQPPCCNPAHLFAGTHHENMLDAHEKGRLKQVRGSAHWAYKIDREQLVQLRSQGLTQRQIAKVFGVSQAAVSWSLKRIAA